MKNLRVHKIFCLMVLLGLMASCGPAATETSLPEAIETTVPETAAPTSAPELVHVKASVLPFLSYAPFFIAQEEGYFAEQNLEVEFVRLQGGSENTTALITGQIDVLAGFVNVGLLNALGQDVNMRIVADKGYLDPDQCTSAALLARKELVDNGTLNDKSAIKNLKITFGSGSITEYFVDQYLADSGISTSDLQDVNIQFNQLPDAMTTGSIDLATTAEPWITRVLNTGSAETLLDYSDMFPNAQFAAIVYGPTFLDQNPDVGQRFMLAYLKGVQQYELGPTDRNIEIVSPNIQIKPAELKTLCWQPIRADGMINIQTIVDFQDWALSKGYLAKTLPAEKFWDPSFIEFANKQMK